MSDHKSGRVCVLCKYPVTRGGYVRQGGKPIQYVPVDYCVNHECIRYGLLSVLTQDPNKEYPGN